MSPHEEIHRASTGISTLDKMLHGGLIPGRSYILAGDSGSGKSTLCGHFLLEGIRNNEEVLYVTIDEPPSDISVNMENLGWDPDKITILNAHPKVRDYKVRGSLIEVAAQRSVGVMRDMKEENAKKEGTGSDLSLPSLQLMLQKEFDAKFYNRVVIDSLISMRLLGAKEIEWELGINSIIRLLTEENITAVLISEIPRPGTPLRAEFLLSCGIIRMHKLTVKDKIYRGIFVEKIRGSPHDKQIRPLWVTKNGIEIDNKKTLPADVIDRLKLIYQRA